MDHSVEGFLGVETPLRGERTVECLGQVLHRDLVVQRDVGASAYIRVVEAEHESRGCLRSWLSFETLLTDWEAIADLYSVLFALTASPVVTVNRAVAVAHSHGPAAGLELLDQVGAKDGLAGFEPYWVARADLCAKLGEVEAARRAYEQAIGLQTDPAARAFLIDRLAALA